MEERGKQKAKSKSKSRHVACLLLPFWFIPLKETWSPSSFGLESSWECIHQPSALLLVVGILCRIILFLLED